MRLVLLGEAYRTTGEIAKSRQYLEQARTRVRSQGPPDPLTQIEELSNCRNTREKKTRHLWTDQCGVGRQ